MGAKAEEIQQMQTDVDEKEQETLRLQEEINEANLQMQKTNAAIQMASVIKANPPNGDVLKGKSGSVSSGSRKSSVASLTREISKVSVPHENGVDELEEVQATEEDKP